MRLQRPPGCPQQSQGHRGAGTLLDWTRDPRRGLVEVTSPRAGCGIGFKSGQIMSPGITALLGLVIRSVPIGNGWAVWEGKLQGGEGALMEPSCTTGGEDPGGREGGWDMSSHLHVPWHLRDTRSPQRLWKDPVVAVPSGHARPSLRDPDHQRCALRALAPEISVSAALFQTRRDAQDASQLLQPPPALQIAPIRLFSPRMVGGKRRHAWPGFGNRSRRADVRRQRGPHISQPPSRAGSCAGREQEGLCSLNRPNYA